MTRDLPALARASIAAAFGRERALRRELRSAIASGATPRRLDETLLQLVPFAGFARAINAFGILRELQPAASRSPRPAGDLRRRGEALCRRIYGGVYGRMIGKMAGFHPDLAAWILEEGYGRVLSRPGLPIRERELLIVSLLAAMRLPKQLESHVRGAGRVGASAGDVKRFLAIGSR